MNITVSSIDSFKEDSDLLSVKVIVDDCNSIEDDAFPGWIVVRTSHSDGKHREQRIVKANQLGYSTLLQHTNGKLDYVFHCEDDWEFVTFHMQAFLSS